jgi:hypothetical protein
MTEAQRRNVIKKFRCSVLDRVPFPEEEYYEIARKALELKPNDRFDSLTEMRHSFQSISEELKQFDLMCDKLFAMEVANKDKVFEKKSADSESSDFDAWLDKFIKEQLEGDPVTETTDGSAYWSGDDDTTDNSYLYFKYTESDSLKCYIRHDGVMYASAFYESSDIRLKQNIKQLFTSSNIPQIKEFDWKESGKHSYGLIAQELESMGYTELVDIKDDGYKSVNYTAAHSLIIGKLQLKIKELEDRIKYLESK